MGVLSAFNGVPFLVDSWQCCRDSVAHREAGRDALVRGPDQRSIGLEPAVLLQEKNLLPCDCPPEVRVQRTPGGGDWEPVADQPVGTADRVVGTDHVERHTFGVDPHEVLRGRLDHDSCPLAVGAGPVVVEGTVALNLDGHAVPVDDGAESEPGCGGVRACHRSDPSPGLGGDRDPNVLQDRPFPAAVCDVTTAWEKPRPARFWCIRCPAWTWWGRTRPPRLPDRRHRPPPSRSGPAR